jgi:putative ABC transport system permease protein
VRAAFFLSWRRLRHDRVRSGVLVACLAVPIFLPLTTARLVGGYERELAARAAETPLVAGPKGSRFDLVLGALWFRANGLAPIPWAEFAALAATGEALCIPMHAGFTAGGRPLVATAPEYLELRGLRVARGGPVVSLGEVVLGARAARELGLGPGDALSSDPRELYDIARPAALKLRVVGVLAARGTPDDDAVFADVKTAWVLAGLVHGHADAAQVAARDERLVIGRSDAGGGAVAFSGALIEENEITLANAADFHSHATAAELPLTSILVVPRDAKAATLMRARLNASPAWQMVAPAEVVDELLGLVLRVKRLLDTFSAVLAASTLAMFGLVLLLSARARRAEVRTLERIGAARGLVARLYLAEVSIVVAAGAAAALVLVAAASALLPELTGVLR